MAAAGSAFALEFAYPAALTNRPIIVGHDPQATLTMRPQPERVRTMVDRALTELTGSPSAEAAWGTLAHRRTAEGVEITVEAIEGELPVDAMVAGERRVTTGGARARPGESLTITAT